MFCFSISERNDKLVILSLSVESSAVVHALSVISLIAMKQKLLSLEIFRKST